MNTLRSTSMLPSCRDDSESLRRSLDRFNGKPHGCDDLCFVRQSLHPATITAPMTSATDLNLWKQQLGTVPESVWERTDLETLVLADNGLTDVSGRIGGLKRLRM